MDRDGAKVGDLCEVYDKYITHDGLFKGRLYFMHYVGMTWLSFVLNSIPWRLVMFKNHMKIIFRNFKKFKGYSFINIFGLAVGMACAMFILVFVQHELSYDRFHPDVNRIYQVLSHNDLRNWTISPTPLGPALQEEFPEIEETARYHWIWGGAMVSYEDRSFNVDRLHFSDASFFKLFHFPFIQGDPEQSLDDPNSVVITKAMAKKYFLDEDPLGKTLTLNQEYSLTVTGVIDQIPPNSTIRFDMLVPIQFNMQNLVDYDRYNAWDNIIVYTYIKCRDLRDTEALADKIGQLVGTHSGREYAFSLLPFTERYFFFYSSKTNIYAFLSVAVFILLIACLNFMNLAIARSSRRMKEIGMRKIVGACRKQIIGQFLGESILVSFIAGLCAAAFFFILFPIFETVIGKNLIVRTMPVVFCLAVVALPTGLVSGSYPALVLSNVRLTQALNGRSESGTRGSRLRKVMVVFQFIISTLLLIGMIVVHEQRHFMQRRDVGYNEECLVAIPMGGGSDQFYQIFKSELKKDPRIQGVTGIASALPFFSYVQGSMVWEGKKPDVQQSVNFNMVDYDFVETLQIDLLEGRPFSREFPSDIRQGYLINEAMADLIGIHPVVGTPLGWKDSMGKVVGVIGNFHFHALERRIGPLVLQLYPDVIDNLLVRIRAENMASTLSFIEKTWKAVVPDYPFEYSFLDDALEQSLFSLVRTGRLISAFCVLAVIISCLGLFGLSSYTAEQRIKEIGVRKVLGASTTNIVGRIFKEFSILIVIANIIVWPISYVIMNQWLQNFAYRVNLSIWIFILSGLAALAITLATVSYQTIKAATANPVEVLKYE